MRFSPIFAFAAVLAVACLPLTAAEAQNSRAFGHGAPFTIDDLPPGLLHSQLAALPQAAQDRALDWLHRFDFTEDDLPYLHVDANGGVYFADTDLPERAPSTSEGAALEPISAADAFTLHSRPGAPNIVYLDFTGHVLQNTAWNASFGESSWTALAYDLDGSPGTFNAAELSNIAEVWHRLAEDMAPFDVDVTTEEPASFGPKTGRVLITAGIDANGVVMPYGASAGGVAYVGVWGRSDYTYYSPALVYYDNLGNGWPPYVTEASTHELGHNLGLSHDGAPGTGYYTGHGSGYISWAPIMGVGYYRQVTQWSKGEYDGATQTQDDIAIITGHLDLRGDDHESASHAAGSRWRRVGAGDQSRDRPP